MLDALSAMRTAGAEVVFLSGGEAKQLLAELDATSGGTLDAGPTVGAVTFTGEARTLKGETTPVVLAEVVGRLYGLLVVRTAGSRCQEVEFVLGDDGEVSLRPARGGP